MIERGMLGRLEVAEREMVKRLRAVERGMLQRLRMFERGILETRVVDKKILERTKLKIRFPIRLVEQRVLARMEVRKERGVGKVKHG